MKTDILLVPMSARWADMRAAALAVEEAGFHGVWTWDHLRDPEAEADPDAGDRLILLVSPPFDSAEIRAAGRMLTPAA